MLLSLLLAVTPWQTPTVIADEACARAACTSAGDVKVCKCVPADSAGEPGLVIEGPAGRHLEWDARASGADVSDFLVFSVDLDGDGAEEQLIANFVGEAGPVAVRAWELSIVDGATAEVTHALVHDFGRDVISSGCTVLFTEWELVGATPVFVGREFRYEAGRLVATREPVRRRVLDAAFEAERAAQLPSPERTLPARAFLGHPSTRKGEDPAPKAPTPMLVTGLSREDLWLQLHLQRRTGEFESALAPRLGSTRARRLYPLGYAPPDAEGWLVGRAARVVDGQVWVD
jgi:hypothetical protein